ncbi:alpha-glucosidase C-terminal domain-containing protein, partial [Streptomyces sp. NPDC001296]
HPVELIGGVRFPAIGQLPYLLTLAGHGFYWFRLRKDLPQATKVNLVVAR